MINTSSSRVGIARALWLGVGFGILLAPLMGKAQNKTTETPPTRYFKDESTQLSGWFTPAFEQQLTRRSECTIEGNEDHLASSDSYVKIGTIEASEPASDTAARGLQGTICAVAEDAGGDHVYFTKSAVPTTVSISVDKYSAGCARWYDSRNYGNPNAPCEMKATKVGTKLKSVNGVVSAATVWRYDPVLAATRSGGNVQFAMIRKEIGGIGRLDATQMDAIQNLLASDAGLVNSRDKSGRTLLHWAALGDRDEVVRLLITRGADVNARDNDGQTPLHYAVRHSSTTVDILLANHADANAKDKDGRTPLTTVVDDKCDLDRAKLLVSKGADVNAKGYYDRTPLHEASQYGCKDIAEFLLARGADVNVKDDGGYTPLMDAMKGRYAEVADLLRQHGAQPMAPPAAPAAPAALTVPAGTFAMIGKSIHSTEVKTWLDKIGVSPEISKGSTTFYSFQRHGIALLFQADVLIGIKLYSEGVEGCRRYAGDLPSGLSFQMTRREIESILGPPGESNVTHQVNAYYPSKGIYINYDRDDPHDLTARIQELFVKAPK